MNTAKKLSTTEQTIADYLAEQRITYTVTPVGETKRDEWACDEWRVTLAKRNAPPVFAPNNLGKKTGEFETRFYTGLGHRAKPAKRMSWDNEPRPVAPSAATVLHSMLGDAQGAEHPFDCWCADYGYDTDSIKALGTYNACCEIRRQVNALFTREQRDALRAMLEDF